MNKTDEFLVFKNSYIHRLKNNILEQDSFIEKYLEPTHEVDETDLLATGIKPATMKPELETAKEFDSQNAILLFEYLHTLTLVQANDKRVWSYLTHVSFRKYMQNRWGIENGQEIGKTKNRIFQRWFGIGEKGLLRNGLFRLWWGAFLTVAPWEDDNDGYFDSIKTEDRFVYTKILFSDSDLYMSLVERDLSNSKKILIAILHYILLHPEVDRPAWRLIATSVRQEIVFRKLEVLSFEELTNTIEELADNSR